MNDTVLVTGGAGFIGSNFVLNWIAKTKSTVVNLDLLTYAGNRGNLRSIEESPRHIFVRGDIGDGALVASLLREHKPRAILHFAAESHVDRSIEGPAAFIQTNVGKAQWCRDTRRIRENESRNCTNPSATGHCWRRSAAHSPGPSPRPVPFPTRTPGILCGGNCR